MKYSVFFLTTLLLLSCKQEEKEKEIVWTNEQSTKLNSQIAAEEELNIKLFLARKQDWKIQETGTGLRYYIYENGNGIQAVSDDYVDVEYKVTLLDGTLVHETASDEVEEFKMDKSHLESGIQEALKLLGEGDKAKLIIPSHLAHGIVGDLSKVPPVSTLLVDIKLVKVYKTKNY